MGARSRRSGRAGLRRWNTSKGAVESVHAIPDPEDGARDLRLFVLGATGKTGGALVAQAVARDHVVTTFGRSPFAGSDRAKVVNISGNPMSDAELADALPDHDAVLSVLGTRGLGATSVLEDSSRATIAAMRKAGVRRLVILSSALLDTHIGLVNRIVSRTLLRHFSSDQRAMERLVTASDLDWTVLR
ncbi:MAG TPA: NAD(P)-binding oxidoreductase, partial [Gemmatimonadaceae bacterium]